MGYDLEAGEGYKDLARHYLECFRQHGDSHLGADWRSLPEAQKRYQVMLELIRLEDRVSGCSLLDLGCGTSVFYDHLLNVGLKDKIDYAGLDINPELVEAARRKFPGNAYYCMDMLQGTEGLPVFDYIVMNGVFTQRHRLSHEEMFRFLCLLVSVAFRQSRRGVAFNVVSKHVDWEKDGNFYLPFDQIGEFLTKELSRNFVMRHDYGLYEYTVYLYQ